MTTSSVTKMGWNLKLATFKYIPINLWNQHHIHIGSGENSGLIARTGYSCGIWERLSELPISKREIIMTLWAQYIPPLLPFVTVLLRCVVTCGLFVHVFPPVMRLSCYSALLPLGLLRSGLALGLFGLGFWSEPEPSLVRAFRAYTCQLQNDPYWRQIHQHLAGIWLKMYYLFIDNSITKQVADMVHYFFVNPFMSHFESFTLCHAKCLFHY